ncbi:hypothetical protein BpHYR1_054065 [Brachionus plicatilis]|uniref:Uncharacterized protein n=1 Tax=Brachionus plicatilis TaxID=10195 RepID=A0A3M7RC03_BRAPC|nr:hypothetical protein BpHYR1_054065 [Brachionus plicatilis]
MGEQRELLEALGLMHFESRGELKVMMPDLEEITHSGNNLITCHTNRTLVRRVLSWRGFLSYHSYTCYFPGFWNLTLFQTHDNLLDLIE